MHPSLTSLTPKRTTSMTSFIQLLQKFLPLIFSSSYVAGMVMLASTVLDMMGVHGRHDCVTRNTQGESLMEFAVSCNLVTGNTCFEKLPSHLITYTSGKGRTQIAHVLFHKSSASMWGISKKTGGAGKPGRKVAQRMNIKRPSPLPNLLYI